MTSASNETQIRARKRRAAEDLRINETIIRSLMSHLEGRRWIWNKLSDARLFHADMELDPYRMAFDKGVKWATIPLLQDISRITPQDYVVMTQENTAVRLLEAVNEDSEDD